MTIYEYKIFVCVTLFLYFTWVITDMIFDSPINRFIRALRKRKTK